MEKYRLGKTKFFLSRIGLGTVQFGINYGFTKEKTQEEVNEILEYAYDNGINFLDTARAYGTSEEKIGNYIEQKKKHFFIASKLDNILPEDANNANKLKTVICKSIELSLKNLKVGKLDILQLHKTDKYLINNDVFWRIIQDLKRENMIDGFGVSVYEEDETRFLIDNYKEGIDFFQIPYNLFDRRFEKFESDFNKFDIGVICRSVYLKGIIPCKIDELPVELEDLKSSKTELEKIAEKLCITASDLALLFVNNKKFITSVILGINSISEIEMNIRAINIDLSSDTFELLKDLRVNNRFLIDPRQWKSI